MIPSKTMVNEIGRIYDAERVQAIFNQFQQAQGTVGMETIIGKFSDKLLEPGWYLEIYQNTLPPKLVRLHIGEYVIGRNDDCNIILENLYISRIHCMITVHADGRIILRDLQSANHVVVNGIQMESEGRDEIHANTEIHLSLFCRMILKKIE